MQEPKKSALSRVMQGTLSQIESQTGQESEYGHLLAHLLDEDEDDRVVSSWTRVFSRSSLGNGRAAIYPLGPDLLYDRSLRDVMSQNEACSGEILFSPLSFRR